MHLFNPDPEVHLHLQIVLRTPFFILHFVGHPYFTGVNVR